jgi:protoporphyrinogen oxidase
LGIWNSFLIGVSYLYAKLRPSKEENTFEQWVSNRFGKRLFNIFFKTYTEKVWGIPCQEIRAEWAAQRIKGLSLLSALKNALMKSQNNSGDKKHVIKTLIDEFDYPKYGPGMMWKAVANDIQTNGSEVWQGAEVVGILLSNNRIEAVEVQRDPALTSSAACPSVKRFKFSGRLYLRTFWMPLTTSSTGTS